MPASRDENAERFVRVSELQLDRRERLFGGAAACRCGRRASEGLAGVGKAPVRRGNRTGEHPAFEQRGAKVALGQLAFADLQVALGRRGLRVDARPSDPRAARALPAIRRARQQRRRDRTRRNVRHEAATPRIRNRRLARARVPTRGEPGARRGNLLPVEPGRSGLGEEAEACGRRTGSPRARQRHTERENAVVFGRVEARRLAPSAQ